MKAETDIITSIAASSRGQAVILAIMYVETFTNLVEIILLALYC
jgi:hypothetical protein